MKPCAFAFFGAPGFKYATGNLVGADLSKVCMVLMHADQHRVLGRQMVPPNPRSQQKSDNQQKHFHLSSGDPYPWVQEDISDVGYELRHQHDEDGDNRACQKQVDVVVASSLNQRPTKTFVVEQGLDDHDAV